MLFAYNLCRGTAVKPVLVMKLLNEKGREEKCGNLYKNRKFVLDPVNLHARNGGWLVFNITAPVKAMRKNAKRACKDSKRKKLSVIIRSPKCISPAAHRTIDNKKWKPYLEIRSADNPRDVKRKYGAPLNCTPGEKRCCLQRNNVSLKELGDWTSRIIIPTVFPANFCRGLCSGNFSSNHSHIAMTESCCVPTKTSPLSAVYFEAGQFSVKNLRNIQVHECGCA